MNEKEVIEALEQFAREYPNGFSADVLKVIRDLKAEIEEAKAEAIQEQNSDGRI